MRLHTPTITSVHDAFVLGVQAKEYRLKTLVKFDPNPFFNYKLVEAWDAGYRMVASKHEPYELPMYSQGEQIKRISYRLKPNYWTNLPTPDTGVLIVFPTSS